MAEPIRAGADAWLPKSLVALRSYSRQTFVSDLVAGITVGLVALPLAMAFAIASGLTPQAGLYTAIVAGFIISAFGGSMTQIGGPTGAFVVVVAGVVAKYGVQALFTCTLLAGIILVMLGITGLGTAIKFIPRPVVIGFTNGIAVLIASTQVKELLGLRLGQAPGDFISRMVAIGEALGTIAAPATILAFGTIVSIAAANRYQKRVPGTIVALLAGTLATYLMGLHVETVGTRFGGVPSILPELHVPSVRLDLLPTLLAPALTIAMLGAIESLMSAVVADRMSNDRHNPNLELVAQGFANMASPLVGGLPATGAIARTATNIRSGARTPVAGIVHALVLLLMLLFAAPLAAQIPMPVLAGILMVVAYNMGEWGEIPAIMRQSRADTAVWLITFSLTVLADLTVAVEAGMILAALLYIRRVTATTTVAEVTPEYIESGHEHILQHQDIPGDVSIFRIHGPFLFGSTDKLEIIEEALHRLPPIIILRLVNMTAIDGTGLSALEELAVKLRVAGRHLILSGMRDQPAAMMEQARFSRHVGKRNMKATFTSALERARELSAKNRHLDL